MHVCCEKCIIYCDYPIYLSASAPLRWPIAVIFLCRYSLYNAFEVVKIGILSLLFLLFKVIIH